MMRQFTLIFAVFAASLALNAHAARADGLAGSWSGGGSVRYADTREKARCRASYSRISGTLYRMTGSCATASGRVDQTATVNRVGNNEWAGSFHNKQYNVSGSIHITLRGDSQTVHLSGSGGNGSFRMQRN